MKELTLYSQHKVLITLKNKRSGLINITDSMVLNENQDPLMFCRDVQFLMVLDFTHSHVR